MSRTKTVDPRKKRKTKKKVRFTLANTPTQDRVKRIQKKKKKRNLRRTQTGKGLADNLANLG